ncbi:MAG: flagellar protein FlaG [Deltaproteobacteria bacterium]|nr:flagellar protein FlaG [Deltaproteobacteria bacterium]
MAIAVVNISGMTPAYVEKKQPAVRERVSIDPAPQDEAKPEVKEAPKAPEINVNVTKAVFAVDGDKNVVVRIIDSDGKVLRQIPPEEYMATVARLRELAKSLFDTEV